MWSLHWACEDGTVNSEMCHREEEYVDWENTRGASARSGKPDRVYWNETVHSKVWRVGD